MRHTIIAAILFAGSLAGDARVHVTERGKTYHQTRACMSLARTRQVYEVAESAAVKHGLKKCGICWRTKTPNKADKSGWMKEGK